MSKASLHAVLMQALICPSIALGAMLLIRYGSQALGWACRKMQQSPERTTPSFVENEIIIERLQEGARAATRIRGRVSLLSALFILQGLVLTVLGEMTFLWREVGGINVEEGEEPGIVATWFSEGSLPWWEDGTMLLLIGPWAVALGALAMRPVDGASARAALNWLCFFCIPIVVTFTIFLMNVAPYEEAVISTWPYIMMQSFTLAFIVFLVPSTSLGCCGPCCMGKSRLCRWCSYWIVSTPRQTLRRFWLCIRLFTFLYGSTDVVTGIHFAATNEGTFPYWAPATALSISWLLFSFVMTPYVRGVAIRRIDSTLARLLEPKGEVDHGRETDAASISALMDGTMESVDVYIAAKRLFCALPVTRLTRAMMNRRPSEHTVHKHRSVLNDTSPGIASINDADSSYSENQVGEDLDSLAEEVQRIAGSSGGFFDRFAAKCTVSAVLGEVDAFLTYSCESALNHA
jgi:hypothetical protein